MNISKRMILTSTVAVLALCTASFALAGNVIVNGDFESGDLSGWVTAGMSPSSTIDVVAGDNGPSFPGNNSVFMDNQVSGLGLVLKQSTLPGNAGPGTVYYSFDLKLGQADLGGVFFVEIFAEQDGAGIIAGSGVMGPYTPADWTTFQGTFEAPLGTDFLTIQFGAITGANIGSVSSMSVDNVSMDQSPVSNEDVNWGAAKALYR